MDELKLPEIPIIPVPSFGREQAAERVGDAFVGATDELAEVVGEIEKGEMIVQTQEAALQTANGLKETLLTAQREPYVSPERLKELFGGEVPKDIDLTEPVPNQPDDSVRQPRKVIPMHEVLPQLFERQAGATTASAARNIKVPAWRQAFQQAASEDVAKARGEAAKWQISQRLADMEIRTESQLAQAAAARNWQLYEAILNTPDNQLSVEKRQAYREGLPLLKTEAVINDRLRGAESVEELDSLMADIAGQRVKSEKDPEAPFHTKLSPEQQYRYTVTARARKQEIITQTLAAAKAAKEAEFQEWANAAEEEIKARQVGLSTGFSITDIPSDVARRMDLSDFLAIKNALDAPVKRETDWALYNELSRQTFENPAAFVRRNLFRERGRLADAEYEQAQTWQREVANRLANKSEPGYQGPVPGFLRDEIERWVAGQLQLDPKPGTRQQREFNEAVGRSIHAIAPLYRNDPDRVWTYNDVSPVLTQLFSQHPKVKNAARANIAAAITASGKPATDPAIDVAEKQIKTDAPIVDKAFRRYIADTEPDDAFRALVHGELISNLEHIRKQLTADGRDPDNRALQIERAVQNLAREESAEYARGVEEDELKARMRAEGNTLSEKRQAEEEAERAAERKRRASRADWERQADEMEDRLLRQSDVEETERARRVHGSGASMGGFRITSPVSAADNAVRAEVERTREERHTGVRLQLAQDREAYRDFLSSVKAGDSVAVELWRTLYLDNFETYVKARREGKVY